MFHEPPIVHQTLTYKPHANIEIPLGMKKFFPHQTIDQWQYLVGAAAIPAGWAAARPQYTKSTTDIFLKTHLGGNRFGGASPAY
jgi:hypothetical protein